jgi:hypothetical protein
MRLALGLASALAAVFVIGCGDPGGANEFTFDPIPVATVGNLGTPFDGMLASVDANCDVFAADQILVIADLNQADDLIARLDKVKFTVAHENPVPGASITTITFNVPAGSVPDAVEYAKQQAGVTEASNVGWSGQPPEGPRVHLLPCPTPGAEP